MKITFITILLFLISINVFSQDIIVRNNGVKIECEVTSTDSSTVYFNIKRNKKDISTKIAQSEVSEIIYAQKPITDTQTSAVTMEKTFGGYNFYHEGRRLQMNQLVALMKHNDLAYRQIKAAQSNYTLAMILSSAGGFMIGWPLGSALAGGDPNWALAGIGAGLVVVSIPISQHFNKQAKEAIGTFNGGLVADSFWDTHELNIAMGGNGIGLAFHF